MFVKDFADEYARYRAIGDKALAQVSDEGLNRILAPNGNSIAMIVRHMSGNMLSRFTDFLTTDGEKPWRDRDGEFAEGTYTRAEIDDAWQKGWAAVETALDDVGEDDLQSSVKIRGQELSVHEALCRCGDQREKLRRVEYMTPPDVADRAGSHKIDPAVPCGQQRDVALQPRQCFT